MKKKLAVLCCGWSHDTVSSILKGMKKEAEKNNTDLYIFNGYNYKEYSGYLNTTGFSIYRLINYEDFDGAIILSDTINNARVLEKERQKIIAANKPAISINYKMQGLSYYRVDNYSGFYEIIDHLVKKHSVKDIVYLTGSENQIEYSERYKAYRQVLADNQIPFRQENVISIKESSYNLAYDLMLKKIMDGAHKPEAIVCSNDSLALGVLKAAEEKNIKVPEEIKILGYDNIKYSKSVIPSLTTVDSCLEQLGAQSVLGILNYKGPVAGKIKSIPIYRKSCGCECEVDISQKLSTLDEFNERRVNENFALQVDHLEEVFTQATDVFSLLTSLETFFKFSHSFEGTDFCIFLKSDWTSVFVNSEENLPQNLSYGNQVQSIISIMNNQKYLREMINIRELVPQKMKTEKPSIYFFMPIFNHSYVHGYYVCKDSLAMLDNHFGYTWTRTLGTSIERFRKRNMYKQMSQKFLRLSTNDALSGLLNRIGLDKLVKPFFAQNKKNGLTNILYFVDINSMKTINDKFGHLHGDLAVKTIASSISAVIPKSWMAVRYGGDEFLILGNNKNYNGEDYSQLISNTIANKTSNMQLPYNLSASIGSYSVPPNSDMTLEDAVKAVDEIMYKNKQKFHQMNK